MAGDGALSGPSIARTTSTGALSGSATLSGTAITRTTNGGDLQAFSSGAISGVGISYTLSLGDLLDITPPAPPVTGGSGAGGGGGWHQGENARFNLKGSPGFEFSTKKATRSKKLRKPVLEPVVVTSAQMPTVNNVSTSIDDDELAVMLLLGAVQFPSQPGLDDDEEAIWVLLQ
jgi:hypothetical protein